jgi:hypothetical protein
MTKSMNLALDGDMTHGLAPEPMSEPCARYFAEQAKLYLFQEFLLGMVTRVDSSHASAFNVMLKTAQSNEERAEALKQTRYLMNAFKTYESFSGILCEMWLCRIVDNYLAYVSELLALIFSTKPSMLKSRESISLEEALSYNTLADLVASVAERRIHQLSYQGLAELSDHLNNRFGFPLFNDPVELARARRSLEARNVLVHNRGLIGRISASRLPDFAAAVGSRINVTHEDAIRAAALFSRSVVDLESRAVSKFDIPLQVPNQMTMIKEFCFHADNMPHVPAGGWLNRGKHES